MATEDKLAPYYIKNIEGLDSEQSQGIGAYGYAIKVTVNRYPCIAKRLHTVLCDPKSVMPRDQLAIKRRFREECILLSQLRHPNVVQFIGVHCGKTQDELTLVMEALDTDLERYLTSNTDVPLPIQLSILLDVSYGLLYLHSHSPPIIHRDLTARNILIRETDATAKIADLGVSKILDTHPLSAVARTTCPGSLGVMPPEALVDEPSYSTKLDDFSFGTLILHVVNHEFPMPFEVDRFERGKQHITKRRKALSKMGTAHCLYPLVIQCLLDNPQRRPTTVDISQNMEALCKKHPQEFRGIVHTHKEIEVLRKENQDLKRAVEAPKQEAKILREELLNSDNRRKEVISRYTHQLDALAKEFLQTKTKLDIENAKLCGEVQLKTEQVDQHEKQADQCRKEVEQYRKEVELLKQQVSSFKQQMMLIKDVKDRYSALGQELENLTSSGGVVTAQEQTRPRSNIKPQCHDGQDSSQQKPPTHSAIIPPDDPGTVQPDHEVSSVNQPATSPTRQSALYPAGLMGTHPTRLQSLPSSLSKLDYLHRLAPQSQDDHNINPYEEDTNRQTNWVCPFCQKQLSSTVTRSDHYNLCSWYA